MPFLATGTAIEAFVDALIAYLRADATLVALVTGIYGHVPEAARTAFPYVRLSSPSFDQQDFGGMGVGGGRLTLEVDAWSNAKGPHAIRVIMARIKVLLMRADLVVVGHHMAGGSLVTTDDRDFDEPDPDMPEQRLYRGHQTWEALIEEA